VADDDLRQFTRDLLNRFERRTAAMERRLDAQTAVLFELGAEIRENTAAVRDMRDAIRANTQAVLHGLDGLRGPGPAQA
jgi:uncharacterized coiled-coil protein SlyX